jgi:membrane associated rhomboid family serine protease
MGLYDRDYTQDHIGPEPSRVNVRFSSGITPVVKWLIIINVAIYVPYFMSRSLQILYIKWFTVFPVTAGTCLQLWRLITYQFLHDPDKFSHLFFNMLCLFFLGPLFERKWGPKRFLFFYLLCGAMGGVLYILLVATGFLKVPLPLMGASGAILGIIAAAAILYPKAKLYVMGVFPIPLMVLASILVLIAVMTIARRAEDSNAGGEAAHLAGMATGAIYVLSQSWRATFKTKIGVGAWERKMTAQRDLQREVDRILEKIHQNGIQSLSYKEKKILRKATEAEQTQNNKM